MIMKRILALSILLTYALIGVVIAADSDTDRSSDYILNRAFNAKSLGNGRKTVTSAGTAEALSSTSQRFGTLTICAETDNTNPVTVGSSTVVGALATRQGVPLAAGDCYTLQCQGNLNEVYIDSITNGEGVTYTYQN